MTQRTLGSPHSLPRFGGDSFEEGFVFQLLAFINTPKVIGLTVSILGLSGDSWT